MRALANDPGFSPPLVHALERLPGFRNILVHEYVALDMARVVDALENLDPVEQFVRIVAAMESGDR